MAEPLALLDRADGYTEGILVDRLHLKRPKTATRFIRVGGFTSDTSRSRPHTLSQVGLAAVAAAAAAGDKRTPEEARVVRQAYKGVVVPSSDAGRSGRTPRPCARRRARCLTWRT